MSARILHFIQRHFWRCRCGCWVSYDLETMLCLVCHELHCEGCRYEDCTSDPFTEEVR